MNITLEYCSRCGYLDEANRLKDALMQAFPHEIQLFDLVPGGGGCFELTVDGKLYWSKLQTDDFPREADMVQAIRQQRIANT